MADIKTDFDINRHPVDKAGARMPTLGIHSKGFAANIPTDVESYLISMHASIGDVQKSLGEAAKAMGQVPPQAFSYSTMSFMPDPANYGLMQWPGINPESLRKICNDNTAPIIIIRQRCDDIARYAGLSSHSWMPGWQIVMRDSKETPGEQDKKDIRECEKFILNCSMDGELDPLARDANLISPWDVFMRGFVDDTLTFDGWAVWTNRDAAGRVNSFCNMPAGMIRLALPTRGYKGDPSIFAALVDETGTPVVPFTRRDLVWRIRNVHNDPSTYGYGWPEAQMMVTLIQAFSSGIDLNASAFTRNSIPNGMLLLKGDFFNQEQIDALMREWTNMKRGVSKLWGLPVMSVPEGGDVEVLDFMDMKGTDVRYKDHMNMMMGLCCLAWRFPIRRLGMFVSGHHKDNQPTTDAAIEIQGADDPGLPPLLMFIENTVNPYLIQKRWPRLMLKFLNKNPKEDARSYEARKLARTWGESRAEADLPKLTTVYPPSMRKLAEIMENCPEDTVKASVYQTVASKMLEAELAVNEEGGSDDKKGPAIQNRKDPAEAQGHGHLGGVRRDSRAEKDRAATKVEA